MNTARNRRSQNSDRAKLGATPRGGDLRSDRGFICAAAGSLVTFVLLFQPWLSASGSGGEVSSDAFGRVDGVTTDAGNWAAADFRDVTITGIWGLLAGAAMVTTVFAVLAHRRTRTGTLACLVMGSSAAVAVLVLCTLLYLDAKGPELRSLIDTGDGFGGGLLGMFFGSGQDTSPGVAGHRIASATLTPTALAAGVVAFGTAVTAIAQGSRQFTTERFRLLWRAAATQPEPQTPVVTVVDEPETETKPAKPDTGQVLWDEMVFDDDLVANVTWVHNPAAPPLHGESDDHHSTVRASILIG